MGLIPGQKHGRKKLDEMSHSQLEVVADRDFSKFIRLRDSDENGYCKCITCGRLFFWKELDNGHYVKRNRMSTRYDEENCNAQCKHCNGPMKGEEEKHGQAIDRKNGIGTKDLLKRKGAETCFRSKVDLIAIVHHYRIKWKKELKKRGLK